MEVWLEARATSVTPWQRYVRAGRGDDAVPVVFLHGILACVDQWIPTCTSVASTRPCFAVELLGHGESARAESYDVPSYARAVHAFLRERVGRPALLAGHSLGAVVAMHVAATAPALVRGLLLEEPPLWRVELGAARRPDGASLHAMAAMLAAHRRARRPRETLARAALRGACTVAAPGGGPARDAAWCDVWATGVHGTDPAALAALIDGAMHFDTDHTLRALACPTALVHGDAALGSVLDALALRRVRDLVPGIRIESIDRVGHNVHWTRPDRYLRRLETFARDLAPTEPCRRSCA